MCGLPVATFLSSLPQDGVPEAVEALLAAGIGVWVLTGDKVGGWGQDSGGMAGAEDDHMGKDGRKSH